MYRAVLEREIPVIGGEDNDERFTNESNVRAHQIRTQALLDLPDVPLFFGRLDYEAGTIEETDRIYIGRRHVHDGTGAPLVIDWRAPCRCRSIERPVATGSEFCCDAATASPIPRS